MTWIDGRLQACSRQHKGLCQYIERPSAPESADGGGGIPDAASWDVYNDLGPLGTLGLRSVRFRVHLSDAGGAGEPDECRNERRSHRGNQCGIKLVGDQPRNGERNERQRRLHHASNATEGGRQLVANEVLDVSERTGVRSGRAITGRRVRCRRSVLAHECAGAASSS